MNTLNKGSSLATDEKLILPKVKVFVVVGVYHGIVDAVSVKTSITEAEEKKREFDKTYGIEEELESESDNDVKVFDCELDGLDGDVLL
jgi:hypothetical protein